MNDQQILTCLGTRLRAARERHQLTLDQVADQTSLAVAEIEMLEVAQIAEPAMEQILPLAKLYGVTLHHLAGLDDSTKRARIMEGVRTDRA